MNKSEFMNILQTRLINVNPSWRDEILSDLEEHFAQAAASGLTEEEAITHLGDPMELAQQFYEEAALADQILPTMPASDAKAAIMNRRIADKGEKAVRKTESSEASVEKTVPQTEETVEKTARQAEEAGKTAEEKTAQQTEADQKWTDYRTSPYSSTNSIFSNLEKSLSSFSKSIRSTLDNIASSISPSDFSFNFSSSDDDCETMIFSQEERLQQIQVSVLTADISLSPSQDENLHVEYSRSIPDLTVSYDNGILYINQESRPQLSHYKNNSIEIYFPSDIAPNMNIKTKVGDIEIYDLSSQEMTLQSQTGDITFQNGKCFGNASLTSLEDIEINASSIYGNAQFNTTSGDIVLTTAQIYGNLNAKSVSGDLELEATEINGNVHATTSSGDVTLNIHSCNGNVGLYSASGDLDIYVEYCDGDCSFRSASGCIDGYVSSLGCLQGKTISGDIDLTANNVIGDITLQSSSGSIDLHTDHPDRFCMELISRTGDTHSNLVNYQDYPTHIIHCGSGGQKLSATTVSGDIEVQFE